MSDASQAVDTTAEPLDLKVGALVVYGGHGIGRVSAEGAKRGSVVVEFATGLSVTLPQERAAACLRPLSDTDACARVREVLRSHDGVLEKSWQARSRSNQAKIASGEAVDLAEVVRDGMQRERSLSAGTTLSLHERELYRKARRLLAAEVGASIGVDEAAAEAWIDHQLDWDTNGAGALEDEHVLG